MIPHFFVTKVTRTGLSWRFLSRLNITVICTSQSVPRRAMGGITKFGVQDSVSGHDHIRSYTLRLSEAPLSISASKGKEVLEENLPLTTPKGW